MNNQAANSSARQHAFPGAIMMGAQSQLIPYGIPLRFFVAAALFHVVAWGLLALGSAEVAEFSGGPGLVLASLHALTLGVLAMTAMGAGYQLLSVATGGVLRSYAACRLSSWLYIPGTALMVGGMAVGDTSFMAMGGGLAVAGLCVFVVVIGDLICRAATLKSTIRHIWAAFVCLGLLAATGLILIADFDAGFLGASPWPDHAALAVGHGVMGGFGFMGFLALGFSYVLVPMFALASAPSEPLSAVSLGLGIAGLVLAVVGVLSSSGLVIGVAGAVGLMAVSIHLFLMVKALRGGMKKRLGLSFKLIRLAWVLLPLSIVVGCFLPGVSNDVLSPSLFGFVLIFGWLLTFLTGVLQRILPFLASMHAHKKGHRAPRLSAIGNQSVMLPLHAAAHGVALMLVAGGIAMNMDTLILAGSLVGGLGAAAFLWFTLAVSWHVMSFYAPEKTPDLT